ncbi:hypothetical protein ACFE04_024303 [Oxalis oulophora]
MAANAKQRLPIEMMEEILKYLPGKSLLRFSSLSKPINSLINTRRFIKRHLSLSVSTSNDLSLIISDVETNKLIVSCDFDTSLQNNQHILKHPFENTPQDEIFVSSAIIGSSHGLICIVNWNACDIALLNPTTRKHRLLPTYGVNIHDIIDSFHGFGYHLCNDDYVVVRLSQNLTHFEVMIFNFNNNDWRKAKEDSFPYSFKSDQRMATFVGGRFHWQVNHAGQFDTTNMVAAFDLDIKNWRIIPLPHVVDSTPTRFHLSTLGECLSIITEQPGWIKKANVWVMKEYGVKKSWQKLFSFLGEGIDYCTNISCLGYSENKDEVFIHMFEERNFWYDLKKKEIRVVEHLPIRLGATVVDVSPNFAHTVVVGSLVSL